MVKRGERAQTTAYGIAPYRCAASKRGGPGDNAAKSCHAGSGRYLECVANPTSSGGCETPCSGTEVHQTRTCSRCSRSRNHGRCEVCRSAAGWSCTEHVAELEHSRMCQELARRVPSERLCLRIGYNGESSRSFESCSCFGHLVPRSSTEGCAEMALGSRLFQPCAE